MFLHFRKALCKAEKKGLRWWGGVSYICTATSSCCCPLQRSTTKEKKRKKCEEQSCSLAHWSSNVTTQLHLCRLTQTQHGTHFILSLGGKMSLSLIVTLFFFYHHVSNVTLHMGQTLVSSPMFELLYWKFYCMPSGRMGPWMLPISNIKRKLQSVGFRV